MIKSEFKPQTLFIGQNFILLDTVDSTNNYTLGLLKRAKIIEGTVIMAREQTLGRGQMGNLWESEASKNLTISLILYPSFLKPENYFSLNKCVSLAIYDFLKEELGDNVKIKWPNDIYYLDNKIGGILIENSLNYNSISSSIIGVGININQIEFSTNANISSLKKITKKNYNLYNGLESLCLFLEQRYLQLKKNSHSLNYEYLKALYRYGEFHSYSIKGEKSINKIVDITFEGKLLLEDEKHNQRSFSLKEISFII